MTRLFCFFLKFLKHFISTSVFATCFWTMTAFGGDDGDNGPCEEFKTMEEFIHNGPDCKKLFVSSAGYICSRGPAVDCGSKYRGGNRGEKGLERVEDHCKGQKPSAHNASFICYMACWGSNLNVRADQQYWWWCSGNEVPWLNSQEEGFLKGKTSSKKG